MPEELRPKSRTSDIKPKDDFRPMESQPRIQEFRSRANSSAGSRSMSRAASRSESRADKSSMHRLE